MANYIKYFQTFADYAAFRASEAFTTPNVSYVAENSTLYVVTVEGIRSVVTADSELTA